MRLREHEGIIPGRIDIRYCRPAAITVEEGYNVRDMTTAEARAELDELKAQVKEHGVITPLKIRFSGEQIILVEGHRRRMVVLELIAEYDASDGAEGRNIEAVPIFGEPSGTTVEERDAGLFISNTGTRLKPLEVANLIYRMHTVRGMPLDSVAKQLGISMPVLKYHLDMRAMPEAVKEQVRAGDVSATVARQIVKESAKDAKDDPEFAAELIRKNKEENAKIRGKDRSHKVTTKTLKRGKADKLPVPERAPRQGEMIGQTTPPSTPVHTEAVSSTPLHTVTDRSDPEGGIPGRVASAAAFPSALAATSNTDAQGTDDFRDLAEALALTVENRPEHRTFRRQILSDLITALKPFADLCNDFDANAKADDDIVEVLFADIKKAWSVYTAATGGQEEEAA